MNSETTARAIDFTPGSYEVLRGELARIRAREVGGPIELKVLTAPHPRSPFLTLAEYRGGQELPMSVLKVLMIPHFMPVAGEWRDILQSERQRLQDQFAERLKPGGSLGLLRLPFTWRRNEKGVVIEVRTLRSLRGGELLGGMDAQERAHPVLEYMIRPYIPWPSLRDSGFSAGELERRWREFCDGSGLAAHVKENPACRVHFYDEALVNGTEDLLLVSAWRWASLRPTPPDSKFPDRRRDRREMR